MQQAPQMQLQPQVQQQQQQLQYQPSTQPQFQPTMQAQAPMRGQTQPLMPMQPQPSPQVQQVQSQMQPMSQMQAQPQPPPQPMPQTQPQMQPQPNPQAVAPKQPAQGLTGQPAGASSPANGTPPLHPEIRSVVGLTLSHSRKIYYSGPMIRKLENQPDGHKPAKDEGWREVWGQLGGTTLSLWDMKAIEEASKQGKQVPPSYINVTDAVSIVLCCYSRIMAKNLFNQFVHAVGAITIPGTANAPPQKYQHVLSLNTAGMNLIFFSCPSVQALISWIAAFRLSAWEKSRLEEIYTAHLTRITLNDGGLLWFT